MNQENKDRIIQIMPYGYGSYRVVALSESGILYGFDGGEWIQIVEPPLLQGKQN